MTDPTQMESVVDRVDGNPAAMIDTKSGELRSEQQAFDDEVLRALQTLPPEPRCCLLLRVLMNLSYAELSVLMNIPEGTAMSHVHRGKQRLREQLMQSPKSKGANHG